jgi:hypothetical protein
MYPAAPVTATLTRSPAGYSSERSRKVGLEAAIL